MKGKRYPAFGLASATGENVIELSYGKRTGVRCVRADVVVLGNTTVKANGRILSPAGRSGNATLYDLSVQCLGGTPDGFPDGISSLTVEGNASYYAVCSLYDPTSKKKPFRPSYLDGYEY